MREAIGGTWIMQLVIVFMLVFVAFLALSLNYSKAFQMKNEVLTMIEKKEGLTDDAEGTIALINSYLATNGYHVQKTCPENSYGVTNLNSIAVESTNPGRNYYYCIQKIKSPSNNNPEKVYYNVNLFFYFNLPVVGDIFKFTINGSTNDIIIPGDALVAIEE